MMKYLFKQSRIDCVKAKKITNSPEKYFKIMEEIGYNTAIVVEFNLLNYPYVVQVVRSTECLL